MVINDNQLIINYNLKIMRTVSNQKWVLSFMLVLFVSGLIAQNEVNETVDKLHAEYKKDGVEAALSMYKQIPEDKEYHGVQEPLNVLGYRLMQDEKDTDAAAAVFKAQIEEHPGEPNSYDSYADAMIMKGNDDEAIKHLNKSIDMLENAEDNDFNNNLRLASKSKLAKLKGLNKVFSFLDGDWEVKHYAIEDGEEVLRFTDDVRFIPSKMNSAMVMRITNEEEGWEGTQLFAYDALNNNYEVVRTNNMQLNGFQTAKMKVEEYSTDKLVLLETEEEDGEIRKVRHSIEKKGENVDWVIYEIKDGSEEKMAHRKLKRKTNS